MRAYWHGMAMGHKLWLHVHIGVDEHPFATYFDVDQGYRVLTHSHLFVVLTGKPRGKLKKLGVSPTRHISDSSCTFGMSLEWWTATVEESNRDSGTGQNHVLSVLGKLLRSLISRSCSSDMYTKQALERSSRLQTLTSTQHTSKKASAKRQLRNKQHSLQTNREKSKSGARDAGGMRNGMPPRREKNKSKRKKAIQLRGSPRFPLSASFINLMVSFKAAR